MISQDSLFTFLCSLSVETTQYPDLQKAGVSQFIESITQLLSRLLEFRWIYQYGEVTVSGSLFVSRNVPEGDENRNQRMSTMSNLLVSSAYCGLVNSVLDIVLCSIFTERWRERRCIFDMFINFVACICSGATTPRRR